MAQAASEASARLVEPHTPRFSILAVSVKAGESAKVADREEHRVPRSREAKNPADFALVLNRRAPRKRAELVAERPQAPVADLKANVRYRHFPRSEQTLGQIHAAIREELVRRLAKG